MPTGELYSYSLDGENFHWHGWLHDRADAAKLCADMADRIGGKCEQWTARVRILTNGKYVVDNIMSAAEFAAQGAGK